MHYNLSAARDYSFLAICHPLVPTLTHLIRWNSGDFLFNEFYIFTERKSAHFEFKSHEKKNVTKKTTDSYSTGGGKK